MMMLSSSMSLQPSQRSCLIFCSISAVVLSVSTLRKLSYRKSCKPPVAKVDGKWVPFGDIGNGNRGPNPMKPAKVVYDPYYWLKDDERKDPKVISYLKAENDYTASKMDHLKPQQDQIYKDLLSHVKETDVSVPYPYGPFHYYHKTQAGASYRTYCRKDNASQKEEVLLNMNELAKGKSHCDLGCLSPSPDHTILAYSLDIVGYETYNAYFLDLKTRELLSSEKLPDLSGRLVWGKDNSTIFYTTQDEAHRPYRLYRHVLGTSAESDELLFEEKDEMYWLGFGKTLSGDFLIVETGTSETTEVHMLDLSKRDGELVLIQQRTEGLRYSLTHHEDVFYVVTNADGAMNQKIMSLPTSSLSSGKTDKSNWREVVPYNMHVNIEDITCFKKGIVVEGRVNGFTCIWMLKNGKLTEVTGFPDPIKTIEVGVNKEYDSDVVRVLYESMVTPTTTFDVSLLNPTEKKQIHQKEVPNYDASLYQCERLEATSHDGRKVPMSMVYKKGFNGPGPLLLCGYGSYGICNEPDFVASHIALLDRGLAIVVAHIRGGGEMGRHWYEIEGKFLQKKNTFLDFIHCAQHLIDQNYTTRDLLAITGRSAGGLLMGAVLNMKPDIARVAILGVPFVDLMNSVADETIPLSVPEWLEWGNPNEEKYYDYMYSYSPYDQIRPQEYPSMLITAGLYDPRVAYWECAKYTAKLRQIGTGNNPLYLKTDLTSGHFSASDRYKYLREKAFEYVFMLDQLGIL